MSSNPYSSFANSLARHLLEHEAGFNSDSKQKQILHVHCNDSQVFALDMTPFIATPAAVSARQWFDGVNCVSTLLSAYQAAKQSLPFEMDFPEARKNVSAYAEDFLSALLSRANAALTDQQAALIANWVKHLDVYCAVKSVESFLYSHADLKLLEIAPDYGWDVVFDVMASRGGSQEYKDAETDSEL